MIQISVKNHFSAWRIAARALLSEGVRPNEVLWSEFYQNVLFAFPTDKMTEDVSLVPRSFLDLAEAVACHADTSKWGLLYSLLHRLVHDSKHLLEVESDAEVRRARLMEKAVNRDVHKFHAFVRFRRLEVDGDEFFIAWHEPQHYTVERAAPFFMRRFGDMRFSILTPQGCAHWNKKVLVFSDPVDKARAPKLDEMEDYWLLYYKSIFNPLRLKVKTMKKELPVRHWATLPEAVLIPEMVRRAGEPIPVATLNKLSSPLSRPSDHQRDQ